MVYCIFVMILTKRFNMIGYKGTWVVRSVKHQTFGFSSGHDLTVHKFKPYIRLCVVGILSLSALPLPIHVCMCMCALSLQINK